MPERATRSMIKMHPPIILPESDGDISILSTASESDDARKTESAVMRAAGTAKYHFMKNEKMMKGSAIYE